MISKFIKIGDKIEMQSPNKKQDNDENNNIYLSRVQGILSEDSMEITMPMEQTKLVLLPIDSEFDLVIYGEGGLYQCTARIADRYKSNNVYILAIELTTNLRKFQRREYYRFSCALELNVRPLTEGEKEAVENKNVYEFDENITLNKGVIVDISGGGMRFMANQQYDENSLLFSYFSLIIDENVKKYETIIKVIASRELPNRPGTYEYRVQFYAIKETIREEIIRFIFEQERKERKRRND